MTVISIDQKEKTKPQSLAEEFAKLEKNFPDLIKLLADEDIPAIHRWIESRTDPDMPDMGKIFMAQIRKADCGHRVDANKDRNAYYNSYSYEMKKNKAREGFMNEVVMGINDLRRLPNLYSNEIHESGHAAENDASPVLQASHRNPNTRVIICPEDTVRLEKWCEDFSYAMQALFNTALAVEVPEVEQASVGDPVSVSDFKKIRQEYPRLKDAVLAAAKLSMTKIRKGDTTFQDYYRDCTLSVFEQKMKERREIGERDHVFVKLGDNAIDELLAIANACLPGLFIAEDISCLLDEEITPVITKALETDFLPGLYTKEHIANMLHESQFPPKIIEGSEFNFTSAAKLKELNALCGITDKAKLQTLPQFLATQNMEVSQFVALSRSNMPVYKTEPLKITEPSSIYLQPAVMRLA